MLRLELSGVKVLRGVAEPEREREPNELELVLEVDDGRLAVVRVLLTPLPKLPPLPKLVLLFPKFPLCWMPRFVPFPKLRPLPLLPA